MKFVSKKPIIGGVILVAILGMVAVGAQINPDNPENENSDSVVWHARIAGPEFNNISNHRMDLGSLERGTYKIGFVPMGDSPKKMEVTIMGKVSAEDQKYYIEDDVYSGFVVEVFSEEFILEKSLVDTGISKYYTWDYIGQKYVQIPESKGVTSYEIQIERIGNLQGSVSISLEKVDRSI